MLVCNEGMCCACNACISICPRKCISYNKDKLGVTYAVIDTKVCVECGLCRTVCPQITPSQGSAPEYCYAGWSLDHDTRRTSASGGIAAELYRYEADNGGVFSGVVMNSNHRAEFILTSSREYIVSFQNSKYTHSDVKDTYKEIGKALKRGQPVTFIGLPCQVAGLKKYLEIVHANVKQLFCVDLVCHGVAPEEYLQQHIGVIEERKHERTTNISFRESTYGTDTFIFSLWNGDRMYYKKGVYRNDYYQIGYHSGIIYRSNCYECKYACCERQGDITLADFAGVGKKQPCSYTNKKVSCILVNTDKGQERLQTIASQGSIFLELRPIEEELESEKQLHSPTCITKERSIFVGEYLKNADFESAMRKAAFRKVVQNEFKHYLHLRVVKKVIARCIPKKIKAIIKNTVSHSFRA